MQTIRLPYEFTLRPYQIEPWNAFLDPEFSRGLLVVPRRNGKDILSWNALIAKAAQRRALYYYVAPYYNQVRQIIWEGFDHTGRRFLDYIPKELIKGKPTKLDMRIDLINGSQIKLQGSDQIDRIVGTNPYGIVFTEFSLHKPAAWEYLRPILAENGGWAIFNGTPRGFNHFYHLYKQAGADDSWYTQFLTRDDTGIPTLEAIEEDRRSGMPEELIKQEYYCSFTSGVVGAYYASLMEKAREDGRITNVQYEPKIPVYTFWDLGMRDSTAIWFTQFFGREIRNIDYYENNQESLAHYVKVVKEKPYVYEEHFAPHDITVTEFSTGMTRLETAADLGLDFTVVPKISKQDGIDAVREILPMSWFDSIKCSDGIDALLSYQKRFNQKLSAYSDEELKNFARHGADAYRYMAVMSDMIRETDIRTPQVIRSTTPRPQIWGRETTPQIMRSIGNTNHYRGNINYPSPEVIWKNQIRVSATNGKTV